MKNGCIVDSDGTRKWFLNGKQHREDGPAVEWADGGRWWYLNGLCHREDGPAIEESNGTREWWYEGKCQISKCRHKKRTGSVCPTCLKNFRAKCELLLVESVQES